MSHRTVTYPARNSGRKTLGAGGPTKLRPGGSPSGGATPDLAFNALSDPTRRAVLDLLRAGMRPAGEIARSFTVSRPAISKHLGILRRAHLVEERREGRHRLYQLNPEPLKAVDSWLQQYRTFWTASLNNLKAFVEAEYEKELNEAVKKQHPKKEK
jgi:DNA-binding transcriptional ArsR family regulator